MRPQPQQVPYPQHLYNMIKEIKTLVQAFTQPNKEINKMYSQFFQSYRNILGNNFYGTLSKETNSSGNADRLEGIGLTFQRKDNYYYYQLGEHGKQALGDFGIVGRVWARDDNGGLQFHTRIDAMMMNSWVGDKLVGCSYQEIESENFPKSKIRTFEGSFSFNKKEAKISFLQGTLTQKTHDNVVLQSYSGSFLNNQFHGKGLLKIPPEQYQYQGQFQQNRKKGFGCEYDAKRNTSFFGNFQNNQRDGYGEVVYERVGSGFGVGVGGSLGFRGSLGGNPGTRILFKGFWSSGHPLDKQGIFIGADGQVITHFEKDHTGIM